MLSPLSFSVDAGHAGGHGAGELHISQDPAIGNLWDEFSRRMPSFPQFENPSDPSGAWLSQLLGDSSGKIVYGLITHALPNYNFYRVSLANGLPCMGCCAMTCGSQTAMGVRPTSVLPPNSSVLVYIPPQLGYGIILGVIPDEISQETNFLMDWIQQGANTGIKRERKSHLRPVQHFYKEGGIRVWNGGAPMDAEGLEWGMMAESGVGIFIDAYQAYLRVNEACGLFLNYWDSFARLAAWNMDVQTFPWWLQLRNDEGELQYTEGTPVYPWEALGLYKEGQEWMQEFNDDDVHMSLAKGKYDLPDGEEDLQPIYRCIEYRGYLGQGWQRFLNRPAEEDGKRYFKDKDPDCGLFHDLVALDGSYSLRSAKGIYLNKRLLIPIPKRVLPAEDQESGDGTDGSGYKFSSQFGEGDEHKIGDVEVQGSDKSLRRVAGVLDLLSHQHNWKGLHPFHYHENDYEMPEESDLSKFFEKAQENLNFSQLSDRDFLEDPEAKKLKIDHRYEEVEYFERESFFGMLEDGSVVLGSGCGCQIAMVGGQVQISAPGDIQLLAGKRVVSLGWDVITRAKNSVDISATEKDVRLKAEVNMHLLAGNEGKGGILLESRAESTNQTYEGVYGEDVESSGIVLIAKKSQCAMLGKEVYLRTGGADMEEGPITIDASKGRESVQIYGDTVDVFTADSMNIWMTYQDENPNPTHGHKFGTDYSIISGQLLVESHISTYDGFVIAKRDMITLGNVLAGKNIIAGESMAHKPSMFVGKHDGEFSLPPSLLDPFEQAHQMHVEAGSPEFSGAIAGNWYSGNQLGSDSIIEVLEFSFRDPPGPGIQYRTTQFKLLEPRWQSMVACGMASGGKGWTENPVICQGTETYPWPGKEQWTSGTMYRYSTHTMVEASGGRYKDRPGPYEEPKLSGLDPVTPDGEFKTVI